MADLEVDGSRDGTADAGTVARSKEEEGKSPPKLDTGVVACRGVCGSVVAGGGRGGPESLQDRFSRFKQQRSAQRRRVAGPKKATKTRSFRGKAKPSFAVGVGNGCVMAADVLADRLGWKRVASSKVRAVLDDEAEAVAEGRVACGSSVVDLYWVEYPTKKQVTSLLSERGALSGTLFNHIVGARRLTDKASMNVAIGEAAEVAGVDCAALLPQTLCLQDESERKQAIMEISSGAWSHVMLKEPRGSKGSGVHLVDASSEHLLSWISAGGDPGATARMTTATEDEKSAWLCRDAAEFVVQQYISDCPLLDERKFDLRVYLLVASVRPFVAYYADGYARLSLEKFTMASNDRLVHLTNLSVQKYHPDFDSRSDETVWKMDRALAELDKQSSRADCGAAVRAQIKHTLGIVATALHRSCKSNAGSFELFGADFVVDGGMSPRLLELNRNPDLEMHNTVLAEVLPPLLSTAIEGVLDLHDCYSEPPTRIGMFERVFVAPDEV